MRGDRELLSLWGGRESAIEQDSFGVSCIVILWLANIHVFYKAGTLTWAKSRMRAEHRMELSQQLMAGLHNLLVRRERHGCHWV